MTWSPPDSSFENLVRTALVADKEPAVERFHRERAEIAEQLGARGLLQSGAFVTELEQAAERVVVEFGESSLKRVIRLFEESLGPLTPAQANWIDELLEDQNINLAKGLGGQIDGARRKLGVREGAVEILQRAVVRLQRDRKLRFGPLRVRAQLQQVAAGPSRSSDQPEWDVFISHAGEDRAEVAEPIADALIKRGYRVWLDQHQLGIGDRLFSKIDDGLKKSRFGLVILSPHFFLKKWPEAELNALAALEATEGQKKVLPVWHQIDEAGVRAASPLMAAVFAARTADGLDRVIQQVTEVLDSEP